MADTVRLPDGVDKSVQPLQSKKNYSNSRVLGYVQLEGHPKTCVQKLCVSKMEMLFVSYQGIGIKRMEGEGFTTGRDPTGGVFEEKLSLLKEIIFQMSYLFQQRYGDIFSLKENAFLQNKGIPLEPPTILVCINPSNN